jgi:hypothetical protein
MVHAMSEFADEWDDDPFMPDNLRWWYEADEGEEDDPDEMDCV